MLSLCPSSKGDFLQSYDQLIRNFYYDVFSIEGTKKLTRLCVDFSALNEHRFRHKFDCSSPVCMCGRGIEDNKHFLLHCRHYNLLRRDLFHQLTSSGLDMNGMVTNVLCNLLLFGSHDLNAIKNRIITEAKISVIEATKRLD